MVGPNGQGPRPQNPKMPWELDTQARALAQSCHLTEARCPLAPLPSRPLAAATGATRQQFLVSSSSCSALRLTLPCPCFHWPGFEACRALVDSLVEMAWCCLGVNEHRQHMAAGGSVNVRPSAEVVLAVGGEVEKAVECQWKCPLPRTLVASRWASRSHARQRRCRHGPRRSKHRQSSPRGSVRWAPEAPDQASRCTVQVRFHAFGSLGPVAAHLFGRRCVYIAILRFNYDVIQPLLCARCTRLELHVAISCLALNERSCHLHWQSVIILSNQTRRGCTQAIFLQYQAHFLEATRFAPKVARINAEYINKELYVAGHSTCTTSDHIQKAERHGGDWQRHRAL